MRKNLSIYVLCVFAALVTFVCVNLPTSVYAGDMVIEEGTVYTDTTEKDGRKFVVSKTYTLSKVVINQKVYDSGGKLLSEKTTEKDLGSNVRVVPKGSSTNKSSVSVPSTKNQPTKNVDPQPTKNQPENTQVQKTPETQLLDLQPSTPAPNEDMVILDFEGLQVVTPTVPAGNMLDDKRMLVRTYVVQDALNQRGVSVVKNTDRLLEDETTESGTLIVEGVRTRKALGLFNVEIPVKLEYNAESGELVRENKSLLSIVLNALSF